ncbi:hypothetical protein SLE2022_198940 [Rubroshorea leprosula]
MEISNMRIGVKMLVLSSLYLHALLMGFVIADSAKDKEECTNELVGLATCLPYVGGEAKSPTPDCCSGLKQVLKNSSKCLCLIIKDKNDPDLGLNINVTLALSLPSVCNAAANISKCPELLHLDPNSPEAQVFYQFGKSGGRDSASSSPVPSPSGSPSSEGTGALEKGDGWCGSKRWLGLEMVTGGGLIWYFMASHLSL